MEQGFDDFLLVLHQISGHADHLPAKHHGFPVLRCVRFPGITLCTRVTGTGKIHPHILGGVCQLLII